MSPLPPRNQLAHDAFQNMKLQLGVFRAPGEWLTVTPQMLDTFERLSRLSKPALIETTSLGAIDLNEDAIHPHLILSLLPRLLENASITEREIEGLKRKVDLGYEKIRFHTTAPLTADIRARQTLQWAHLVPDDIIEIRTEVIVEADGIELSPCTAERLQRLIF